MKKKTKKNPYPCVYQKPNGSIFWQFTAGIDPVTNKPIHIKSSLNDKGKPFTSMEEAKAYCDIAKAKFALTKKHNTDDKQGYSDYLDNVYTPCYKPTVKPQTYHRNLSHLKILKDYWKQKPLSSITRLDCDRFKTYLLITYPGSDPRPTASSYANNVWGVFHRSMRYAFEMGILTTLPTASIKSPKANKTNTPYWTLKEFKKIIKTFDLSNFDEQYHATILYFYYFCGFRVLEGAAIQWKDIDFEKKTVQVGKTFVQLPKLGKTLQQFTKTHAGMRTIDLYDPVIEVLKRWKEVQPNQCPDSFVLGRTGTQSAAKTTIDRLTHRVAKKAKVTDISGRGLRKSHACYLINNLGETNHSYVKNRMGHEKIETTFTYYHEFGKDDTQKQQKRKEASKAIKNAGLQLFPDSKNHKKDTSKDTRQVLRLISNNDDTSNSKRLAN